MTVIDTITSIDWSPIVAAVATLITTIAGIFGGYEWKTKNDTKKELNEANEEIQQTQAFFDPDNTDVMTPTERTPERSWKMSDSTKFTLQINCTTQEDKDSVIRQVAEAEKAGYVDYTVVFSNGYAKITYGLISEICKRG